MFAMDIFGGTSTREVDEDSSPGQLKKEQEEEKGLGLGLADLWGAASAAASTFQKTAAEVVRTVGETDWQNELSSFSHGVSDDASEITHNAAEFVEHLPDHIPHAAHGSKQVSKPKARGAEGAAAAAAAAREGEERDEGVDADGVEEGGDEDVDDDEEEEEDLVLPSVTDVAALAQSFGAKLFQGATQIIDQVRDDIDEEMSQAAREGKRAARAGAKAGGPSAAASPAPAAATQPTTAKPRTPEASAADAGLAPVAEPARRGVSEKQLVAMQRDSNTYLDEPEDEDDYETWHAGFSLEGAQSDIDALLSSNAFMAELHSRIVPTIVESEDFWTRYFYRLYKLQHECDGGAEVSPAAKAAACIAIPRPVASTAVAAAASDDGSHAVGGAASDDGSHAVGDAASDDGSHAVGDAASDDGSHAVGDAASDDEPGTERDGTGASGAQAPNAGEPEAGIPRGFASAGSAGATLSPLFTSEAERAAGASEVAPEEAGWAAEPVDAAEGMAEQAGEAGALAGPAHEAGGAAEPAGEAGEVQRPTVETRFPLPETTEWDGEGSDAGVLPAPDVPLTDAAGGVESGEGAGGGGPPGESETGAAADEEPDKGYNSDDLDWGND